MMDDFHMAGMEFCSSEALMRVARKVSPMGPRCFRWRLQIPSGPRALEGLQRFMVSSTSVVEN